MSWGLFRENEAREAARQSAIRALQSKHDEIARCLGTLCGEWGGWDQTVALSYWGMRRIQRGYITDDPSSLIFTGLDVDGQLYVADEDQSDLVQFHSSRGETALAEQLRKPTPLMSSRILVGSRWSETLLSVTSIFDWRAASVVEGGVITLSANIAR